MKSLLYLLAALILVLMFAYLAAADDLATDEAKLVAAHLIPNPKFTQGALAPGVAKQVSMSVLCDKGGYVKKNHIRNVPESVKRKVYAEYGLAGNGTGYCSGPHGCEVDHDCSLELGCTNDIQNLWPQPYDGPWNAHIKDKLENKLHELVCAGKVDLPTAQRAISGNWIKAYQEYMK